METVIRVINILGQILAVLVVFYVLIQMIFPKSGADGVLGRMLSPLLDPIRKRVKPYKGFDFAPLILLIAILIFQIIVVAVLGNFVK
ncbi:MAG: hypothetical protein GX884_02395 [Chloroflexi bacterium]|jgi:uncharacterized protein YggT (Ycf19 family)|nr:hypothetical protein [Chloroflexota bacterium]